MVHKRGEMGSRGGATPHEAIVPLEVAVVAREGHSGAVHDAEGLEAVKQLAEHPVRVGNARVIVRNDAVAVCSTGGEEGAMSGGTPPMVSSTTAAPSPPRTVHVDVNGAVVTEAPDWRRQARESGGGGARASGKSNSLPLSP